MNTRTRESLGAATGIVTAVLLFVSFVIGISPTPPELSDSAIQVADYTIDNQGSLQAEALITSLAMLCFLWFLGSVRVVLRSAEGGAGRVSAIASGGGLVGVGFVLLAQVFAATAALRPEDSDPAVTRLLFDLEALSIGLGAAAFAVFFGGVAVATLLDGGLPRALGWLAGLATAGALLGVGTIFTTEGVFAADGALGFWVRYALFVIWTLVAGIILVSKARGRSPRRRQRRQQSPAPRRAQAARRR